MTIEKVLVADHLVEPHHHQFENIRMLSNDDINNINIASKHIASFNLSYSLFEICTENYFSIEEYYARLIRLRGFNLKVTHDIQVRWNTLILNFLSSFRSFIDHQESAFKKQNRVDNLDDRYSRFKTETAFQYDNNFSYRFLWQLRDYIQHCGFPSIRFEFKGYGDKEEVKETIVNITLDRNSLVDNYDGWKLVKKDLLNQPDAIEVINHIRSLYLSIQKLASLIAQLNIEMLGDKREYLLGLVNEVVEKFPDATPVICLWDVNNPEDAKLIGVEFLPLYSLFDIQDTYLGKNTAFVDPKRTTPAIESV
jgi:hypothetical protein